MPWDRAVKCVTMTDIRDRHRPIFGLDSILFGGRAVCDTALGLFRIIMRTNLAAGTAPSQLHGLSGRSGRVAGSRCRRTSQRTASTVRDSDKNQTAGQSIRLDEIHAGERQDEERHVEINRKQVVKIEQSPPPRAPA